MKNNENFGEELQPASYYWEAFSKQHMEGIEEDCIQYKCTKMAFLNGMLACQHALHNIVNNDEVEDKEKALENFLVSIAVAGNAD